MESNNNQLIQRSRINAKKIFVWLSGLIVFIAIVSWFIFSGTLQTYFQKDNQDGLLDKKMAKIKAELQKEQLDYINGKFEDITKILSDLMNNSQEVSVDPSLLAYSDNAILEISSDNLIRNSSFEFAVNGHPRQWNYILESAVSNTKQSLEAIRSGKYGLKFSGGTSGTQLGISQPVTKTVPGRTYTLSLYVKSVNVARGTTLRFGFWNEFTNTYAYMEEVTLFPTKDWYRVSTTQTTNGQITDWANWYPVVEVKKHTEGAVYIDDVMLSEGSTLIAYSSSTASEQVSSLLGNGSVLISSTGTVYPAEYGIGSLGTANNRWDALYLTNATINENGNMNLSGDLTVNQNLTVGGSANFKGDITLGETTDDTITFKGTSSFPGGITIGENGEFLINSSGNITKVNGVTYSYPSSQGGATTVLINDGTGNLSWGTFGAASVTADSLDFAQFVDSMTVDANTSVNLYNGGNVDLRFYNSNSASELLFLEGSTGRAGIGTTDPVFTLDVNGSINALTFNLSGSQVTSTASEINYVDGASVTTGGIVFGNGTNFTQDAANLFWEDTTNRLGIGTTNPSVALEVNGDIKLQNGYDYYFGNIGLNDTGTSRTTSGASKVGTFDEFANSSSTNVQDVLDDLDQSITTFSTGAGDIEAVGSMTAGAVFADADADDQWLGLGVNLGRIEFDNAVINEVNILDANVGIGTTTPGYTLDVVGNIRAGTDIYIGSVAVGSTAGATLVGVNSAGFVGATGTATVQAAVANLDFLIGDRNYTNTANTILSTDGGTITAALDLINVQIGNRDYTDSILLTDGATITSSLNVLNTAVGSTAYSSTNYVTTGSNVASAIAALDSKLAVIASGTSVSWTDAGVYLHPTTASDVVGNPASAGANKLGGLFLGDTSPLVFGASNNYRMLTDGTNFIFGDTASTFLNIGDSGTTGNFNFNNNQMYLRGDGRLGIGMTNPSSALDVGGTITATGFVCPDCVDTSDIAADTIVAGDIATGAVATAEILDGTILTGDIATDTILAGNIAAGAVGTSEIADGTVSSTDILDSTILTGDIGLDTILAADIAAGAIGTSEILDATILTGDIATDTILATNIAAGAVGTSEIADGTVSTTDILDNTIAAGDIATDAITASELAADSVGDSELFNTGTWTLTSTLNITGGDIGLGIAPVVKLDIDTGSNTDGLRLRGLAETTEIADMYLGSSGQLVLSTTAGTDASGFIEVDADDDQYGFIIRDSSSPSSVFANFYMVDSGGPDYLNILADSAHNLATGLVITDQANVGIGTTSPSAKLDVIGTVEATDFTCTDCIDAAALAASSVGTSEISDGTVSSTDILDSTILTGDIGLDTILAADIAAGAVGTSEIADGTVSSTDILDNTIAAGDIAADAITASELATSAVTTTEILDSTILTGDISADTILAGDIAADAIGDSELFNGGTWTLTSNLFISGSAKVGISAPVPVSLLAVGGNGQSQAAIYGAGSIGVYGDGSAGSYGVYGNGGTYGVFGTSTSGNIGTYGFNNSTGTGVNGENSSTGIGVNARNYGTGYALYCDATAANKCGGDQAWYNASDRRLKDNITPIVGGLSKLLNLQGVTFYMKDDPAKTQVMGFIAQDVLPYVPEVVSYDDMNGYYGMQTSQLTALIVEAVQEQQDMIVGNTQKISSLFSSFDRLSLQDNSITSKVDLLASSLQEVNSTNASIDIESLNQELVAQKTQISGLQEQMNQVFDIVNKEQVASEEADLSGLTDRISLLEQMVFGTKEANASSTQTASEEATLDTTVLEDLTVTGKTNVFDLGVVGDISAGQIVVRGKDATINSLALPLELQSEATAPVEIMAGKVSIDIQGNLDVKASVKAKKFEVDDSEKVSASIGEGFIKAGETEVTIESTSVTESSKIFLTNTKETKIPLAVVEKVRGKSFKVKITENAEEDISFNWWIVN